MTADTHVFSGAAARGATRVLIAGSERGQLFHELMRCVPGGVEARALSADGERVDVTDAARVARLVEDIQPHAIINAAAWTGVDTAESEADAARRVNVDGARNLAAAAESVGAHFSHVSTDFVFGPGNGSPFAIDAPTGPMSVYGHTKLDGEIAVRDACPGAAIVRTAWVYSSHGSNFVKTMLRLMAERDELGVIADQVGSPTWARSLAEALWQAATLRSSGMFHWTGAGVASWYDFAVAIRDEARALDLLDSDVRVKPLTTAEYPTPAARPPYSVMELGSTCAALGLTPTHWREDLRAMLRELT